MTDPCFVFGANAAGRHGKGAALWARQHRGAIYGQGVGPQGNSYAIPTKDENLRPLPLATIYRHCRDFLAYALAHDDRLFELTPVGCGLAGFTPEQIAPAFINARPTSCCPMCLNRLWDTRSNSASKTRHRSPVVTKSVKG